MKDFPTLPVFCGRTDSAITPISISDDDHEPNTDHNELTLPVVPPASFYSEPSTLQSDLQEFRRIRAEQDAEYERR